VPQEDYTNEIDVHIRRGPIDRKQRQLLITPDLIRFEDKNGSEAITTFDKSEICEYRYGIKWIRGFKFTVGREYVIFIRNSSGQTLKISFKTFYGIKKEEYHKLSNDILTALWYFFFGQMANEYYANFKKGIDITIGRATLTKKAVIVDEGGILKSEKKTIPWEHLEIKDYHTYLAIYSSIDASKTHATFSYLKDWNTVILHSIVKTILDNRKVK